MQVVYLMLFQNMFCEQVCAVGSLLRRSGTTSSKWPEVAELKQAWLATRRLAKTEALPLWMARQPEGSDEDVVVSDT